MHTMHVVDSHAELVSPMKASSKMYLTKYSNVMNRGN